LGTQENAIITAHIGFEEKFMTTAVDIVL